MPNPINDDAVLASLALADDAAGPPPATYLAKVRRRRWARRARTVGANLLIFALAVTIWASIPGTRTTPIGPPGQTLPPDPAPVVITASHAQPTLWDLRRIDLDAQLLPGELSDVASDGSSL